MKDRKSFLGQGFTLVEIVIVLILIGLLAASAIIATARFIERSKIVQLLSDKKVFQEATINYANDVGAWPPDVCPQDDPGIMSWDIYKYRCCGQNDSALPFGGPPGGAPYDNFVHRRWNGPYLEKMPFHTPWGGSYDYEYWPGGASQWNSPPGIYLTVRPRYNPNVQNGGTGSNSCNYVNGGSDPSTSVPPSYEVKLQKMGEDICVMYNVTTPDQQVTLQIHKF